MSDAQAAQAFEADTEAAVVRLLEDGDHNAVGYALGAALLRLIVALEAQDEEDLTC